MPLGAAKFSGMGGGQKNPPNGLHVNRNLDNNTEAFLTSQKQINFFGTFNLTGDNPTQTSLGAYAVISEGGGFSVWVKHSLEKTFVIDSTTTDHYTADELPKEQSGSIRAPITFKFAYIIDHDGSSKTRKFRVEFQNTAVGQASSAATFDVTHDGSSIVDGWNHYAFVRGATQALTGPSRQVYNGSLFVNGIETSVQDSDIDTGQADVRYIIPLKHILFNSATNNEQTNGNFTFPESCFQQFIIYGQNFPVALRSDDTFRNLGSDGTRGGEFTAPGLHIMFNHPFTDITTFDSTASLTLDQTGSLSTTSYDCFLERP